MVIDKSINSRLKIFIYVICSILLILLPKVSESSESLADYKIIANNQNTNIELKKLIYYLEQFQINYIPISRKLI